MARPAINDTVTKKRLFLCLGSKDYELLNNLAWETRQSKASVIRKLIERAKPEDVQQ
jgi:hypothetical protein